MIASFDRELMLPLESLLSRVELDAGAEQSRRTELSGLASVAHRWETSLRMAFDDYARRLASGAGQAGIGAAIAALDQTTRWQRMQKLLVGGDGVLRRLAGHHTIEVHALKPGESQLLWFGQRGGDQTAAGSA